MLKCACRITVTDQLEARNWLFLSRLHTARALDLHTWRGSGGARITTALGMRSVNLINDVIIGFQKLGLQIWNNLTASDRRVDIKITRRGVIRVRSMICGSFLRKTALMAAFDRAR